MPQAVIWYDLPVKIVTAGLLLGWFAWDRRLRRWEAAVLAFTFIAYLLLRWWLFPGADVHGSG